MPEAFPGAIITFPMLGESFSLNPSGTYTLFGHTFYWYGAIIGLGFILAALYCMRRAPRKRPLTKMRWRRSMSTFLDTNCLLRYLLADIKDQFETVCRHVENGACTSPEFVAECVYALGGTVYGFDRTDVANTMTALLDDIACEHEAAVRYALELYRNHTLDFADCMLAARFVVEGTPVLTFDKKLNRLLEELA